MHGKEKRDLERVLNVFVAFLFLSAIFLSTTAQNIHLKIDRIFFNDQTLIQTVLVRLIDFNHLNGLKGCNETTSVILLIL